MTMTRKMAETAGITKRAAPAPDMAKRENESGRTLQLRLLAMLTGLSLVAAVLIIVAWRTKDRRLR